MLDDPVPVQAPVQSYKQPATSAAAAVSQPAYQSGGTTDLLDMLDDTPQVFNQPTPFVQSNSIAATAHVAVPVTVAAIPAMKPNSEDFDLFDSPAAVHATSTYNYQIVLQSTSAGKAGQSGLQLEGCLVSESGVIALKLRVTNKSSIVINEFVLQISPNYFGLKVTASPTLSLPPGASIETQGLVDFVGQPNINSLPSTPFQIVFAVKSSIDVFFFNVPANLTNLLSVNGSVSQEEFKEIWKSIPDTSKKEQNIQSISPALLVQENLQAKLRAQRVFYVASKNKNSYYSVKLNNTVALIEVSLQPASSPNGASVSARCVDINIIGPLVQGIVDSLQN